MHYYSLKPYLEQYIAKKSFTCNMHKYLWHGVWPRIIHLLYTTTSHFQLVFGLVILKWWGVEVKLCWHSKSCLFLQYNYTVKMYKKNSTFFPIKEGFHSCILELHLNSLHNWIDCLNNYLLCNMSYHIRFSNTHHQFF